MRDDVGKGYDCLKDVFWTCKKIWIKHFIEYAKFCGSRSIMGLVVLAPLCLCEYFMGPIFFLVGIVWVWNFSPGYLWVWNFFLWVFCRSFFFFLWLIAWFKVIQLLPLFRCLGYCMTLRFRLSFGTDKKDRWSNFVKKIIWEWIHPTQVRSHLNAGEISLRWDDFSPCKHFLLDCPTWTGWC